MKKLLLLFMVFCFLGVFTVSAAPAPVKEKMVMVFVLDVGSVTTATVMEVTPTDNIIIETVNLEVLYTDSFLFRKIVYEPMVLLNGQSVLYKECQTVGDHIPLAA